MRDPVGRLREMLKRDVDDAAAPEDFYDIRPEVWEVFEAGGDPTRELLEAAAGSYRHESDHLIAVEGQWEEALWYRGVALVADGIIKENKRESRGA